MSGLAGLALMVRMILGEAAHSHSHSLGLMAAARILAAPGGEKRLELEVPLVANWQGLHWATAAVHSHGFMHQMVCGTLPGSMAATNHALL